MRDLVLSALGPAGLTFTVYSSPPGRHVPTHHLLMEICTANC